MTYHIALCDDDAVQREYLADLVSAWAAEAGLDVRLALFPSGEAFLARDLGQFSILLLDIEMPGMDGITLARGVRERNETAVIVFITGYAEYIAEGYDVSALHYLMKPVDKSKLFSVLEKAVKTLDKNGKLLPLELGGELVMLPLRDLRYIEVQGNYVTFHGKQAYKVKMPLVEARALLDERFFRTGRSFLVNLHYVRKVTKTDVYLATGEQIPLSRGLYESINRALIHSI
ncbi:MAG: response regulator transcription factor [Clostridia bacterium]|mgnify:CR=1 FL=1|nr:response regulator transcription factor [Clostridia bacterium]